jgi:hypothetical protein
MQEVESEQEPERPSMEAMLLQMLDDGEDASEPTTGVSTAGATVEVGADRHLQEELDIRSMVNDLLNGAVDKMNLPDPKEELDIRSMVGDLLDGAVDKMNLPETAAQVAENEPPVMRELVDELLDTVIAERMGLPQMERSDFQDVAQELLGNAIDLAVDKPTRRWSKELRTTARGLGVMPTLESPDDEDGAQTVAQAGDTVDVRSVAGDLIDAAIERMPILSEWPYLPNDVADIHTVTTDLISDALDKMDLPETIEEIDARYEAAEAAPPVMADFVAELVDTVVDDMGLPEMGATDLREVAEGLIAAALDRMPIANEPEPREAIVFHSATDTTGQQLVDLATPAASADPQTEQPLEDSELGSTEPSTSVAKTESRCPETETEAGDGTGLQIGREGAGQLLVLAIERMDLPQDEATGVLNYEGGDDVADHEADEAHNSSDGTSLQIGREVAGRLLDLALERMDLPQDDDAEAEMAMPTATVEATAANSELADDVMDTKKQTVKKTVQLS